jgi:hypothetical protein
VSVLFHQQVVADAVVEHVDLIAADVRRLRRRFASNDGWTGAYLLDRLAARLDELDAILQPGAAELVLAGFDVDEALETVDRRAATLRRLLGEAMR